ncbi:hypothetical protein OIU74_006149 [Salix koriyanagi]|uniref:Uncharacterized protein n=1 Tax=Salix koriyanagi TaxID=2511006 RepID=A0A9Q0ZB58_9ROSI|nr:hypothetical protein OIU74_006149 [Salix koriyanagi]
MSAARTSRHSNREGYTTWPRRRSSAMGRRALTSNGEARERMKHDGAHPLQIAGSRLPDCSHACGFMYTLCAKNCHLAVFISFSVRGVPYIIQVPV